MGSKCSLLTTLCLGFALALAPLANADEASSLKKKLVRSLKTGDRIAASELLESVAGLPGSKGAKIILDKAIPLGLLGLVDDIVVALSKVSDKALVIKASRSHSKAEVRDLAVRALGLGADEASREACRKALGDKSELVAVAAVRASQNSVERELIDRWIEMLEAEEGAKGKKRRPALLRELITALKNSTTKDMELAIDWKNYWSGARAGWSLAKPSGESKDDTVIGRMKKHRKADVRTLERLATTDVLVIRGSSDKVEQVLRAIDIKHTSLSREEFTARKLESNAVLVINCNGNKLQFSEADIAKISRFVAAGGYLFTSDWELKFTIMRAFPGTIAMLGESKRTERGEEQAAPILPAQDFHPYMRDVFPLSSLERAGYRWKIDSRSHLVKILGRSGVQPLVQCPELGKLYKAPFVAVSFRWDGGLITRKSRVQTGGGSGLRGGAVLHVLGHFKNQRDASDKFALQQLLLNFILEKQRERRLSAGGS